MSTTAIDRAPSALVVMERFVNVGVNQVNPPSFSHHAIVSSSVDVDTISRSRSPSMSAATASYAPMAFVVMTYSVKVGVVGAPGE